MFTSNITFIIYDDILRVHVEMVKLEKFSTDKYFAMLSSTKCRLHKPLRFTQTQVLISTDANSDFDKKRVDLPRFRHDFHSR